MIELHWNTVAEREVTRSNKENIEARNCCDLIDALHCLTILDLKRQETFLIRVLYMLTRICKSPIRVRSGAVEAALPKWWKAHPIHPLPSLLGAPAMRNHDSIRAEFES